MKFYTSETDCESGQETAVITPSTFGTRTVEDLWNGLQLGDCCQLGLLIDKRCEGDS